MGKVILISISILISITSLYSADVINVDDSLQTINISRNIDYIEDASAKLTIDDVVDADKGWTPVKRDSIDFGFKKSVLWFRFIVANKQMTPASLQ